MNYRLIESVLGRLLLVYAAIMGIPFIWGLFKNEPTTIPFLITITLTGVVGFFLSYHGRKEGRMGIREGFAIVSGAWILTSLFGAFPLYLSNAVPTYLDGVFETVSGLTTTGASVISDVEALSQSLLLWRSLTHWLGGMGIIVLFIVFLPKIGAGAVQLFNAEVPGPMAEKVLPRIRDNAARLWQIYLGFTLLQIVLLGLAGMSWFDSINHSFATMATGGFSTKNASIIYYDNALIEFIIIVFMIIAGGKLWTVFHSLEPWFKAYLEGYRVSNLLSNYYCCNPTHLTKFMANRGCTYFLVTTSLVSGGVYYDHYWVCFG